MRAETYDDTLKWFLQAEDLQADSDQLFLTNADAQCIQLKNPILIDDILHQSRALCRQDADEEYFKGATLWILSADSLRETHDRMGLKMVESIRKNSGELRDLETAPGLFFRPGEFVELNLTVFVCYAFRWEAYLKFWSPSHLLVHIRDAYTVIASPTVESIQGANAILNSFGISSVPVPEDRKIRYCRGAR